MNEAAVSQKQLAMSENRVLEAHKPPLLLTAYRLLLIAPRDAICFTVTDDVTSVTPLGLAKGVLINIGKVYLGQGLKALETAKCKGLALLNCSFGEATCIQ